MSGQLRSIEGEGQARPEQGDTYLVRLGAPSKGDTIHRHGCRVARRAKGPELRWNWVENNPDEDWARTAPWLHPCKVCAPPSPFSSESSAGRGTVLRMTIKAQTGPGATLAALTPSMLSPQRLAELTAACLLIDDARLYGLIDGGPIVDRRRCRTVLQNLKAEGIEPDAEQVEMAALELMAEIGVVRDE